MKKHWHKVLCNGGKKPTEKPGANTDRIFCCIAIERQILDKTSSGMMGASSLEDENNISLTSSEGSEEGEDDDEVEDFVNRPESRAGNGLVGGVDVADFAAPLPPLLPPFVDEVPPVQNEVVAAIEGGAVQNEVFAAVDGRGAFCADGGDPNKHNRRRGSTSSRSRKSSKSGKSSSQKTKNSSNKNKERTNVAGAIVKLCESFKDGGTARNDNSTRGDMMTMMMMNQMSMMGARMERQERRERKEEHRERKRARKRKMKRKAKKNAKRAAAGDDSDSSSSISSSSSSGSSSDSD